MTIEAKLIAAGVKNLKEFGYPNCNSENILTDMIYKRFFVSMLEDNKGKSKEVDAAIKSLLIRCSGEVASEVDKQSNRIFAFMKGPWTLNKKNGRLIMSGDVKVATAEKIVSDPPMSWRNARLIAESPEMYYILCGIAAVTVEDSHWGKKIKEVLDRIEKVE